MSKAALTMIATVALTAAAAVAGVMPVWAGQGDDVARPMTRRAPPPPPYSGAYQPHGADEIGLWHEADEDEARLAQSTLVIRDEALTAYVRGVLCSAVGADRCKAVRLYVMRVPLFNASMSPNGTMQVYSGLLLRVRSDAELAAVLGHEFGHFEKRHSLNAFKANRRGSDVLSWAAVLASMGSRQTGRSLGDLKLSVLGSLAKFSRDQEREADLIGLGYLNASPLKATAASRIWRTLILEQEASAAYRGLRKPDFSRSAFFASHPAEGQRVNYLYALAEPDGDRRREDGERYAAALAPWLPQFLDDQIKLNDFGASDFIINHLAEAGWTASLWRARGDLYRLRGQPRDLMNAVDFYTNAAKLDPSLAEAQRGLGLSLIKTGRKAEGAAALRRYVRMRPDAADAGMMTSVLASIGETA